MDMLAQAAVFFAAAVFVVPIFKRLGLGAVLGYLIAGAAIGPAGLSLVPDSETLHHVAEFGVVLLLFIIGLELQPARLWTMRNAVFGLGGAQVIATAMVLGGGVAAAGFRPDAALVIGLGLALSSTAFALQFLAERGELPTRHGRAAFAILLFQDVAAIPILALVPLMGAGAAADGELPPWLAVGRVIGVIAVVVVGGHFLLRPALRAIAGTGIRELFTASALLIVTATALLMDLAGVSMALGAFLAGMLLANSEYRHELEADIEPFKGLLLGLFFITVGMGLNLGLLVEQPLTMTALVVGLLAAKAAVAYLLARGWALDPRSAKDMAITVAQGGEFAFVIFAVAVTAGVLTGAQEDILVLVVSLSMALSPFLALANDALTRRIAPKPDAPSFEAIPDHEPRVIIAGFGRFGQIVGRMLAARKIPFTALDISAEHVDFVKRFGNKVYYGDASRLELLRAAGAEHAKVFVLAIDDVEANLRTAETVRRHFPRLTMFARARNRQHAYRLMDLGIANIQRETFAASLETARDVLVAIGMTFREADRTMQRFRAHDERRLNEHAGFRDDQKKMETLVKAATRELEEMFERDAAEEAAAPERRVE
ncbi:MAG: monovalent cation:proton antiporter-2 (CPA2) family protein [Rhodospirillaceae bacterium]|nr:monovalent cation:proton antiporter-2 (CPA2) family protein [Rhodospirillaceae bacterium]